MRYVPQGAFDDAREAIACGAPVAQLAFAWRSMASRTNRRNSRFLRRVRPRSTGADLCEFGDTKPQGVGSAYLNPGSGRWIARLTSRDGQRVEFSDQTAQDKLEAYKRRLLAADATTLDELPESLREGNNE